MTNEQSAALLQHIARQINKSVTYFEHAAANDPELRDSLVDDLRGLASLLFAQARSMGGTLPRGDGS